MSKTCVVTGGAGFIGCALSAKLANRFDRVVVIDSLHQSKGLGKLFFGFIENWAKKNEYKTIELNTYVQNSKSHKFYYNLGYSILGFHFWKHI